MILSKSMENAIKEKDFGKVYSSFYTILLSDPGFTTGKFDETLKMIKEMNIPGFMQTYNGIPFRDESGWTQQYWDQLASELMDNFCEERIDMIRKVGRKVYSKESNPVSDAVCSKAEPSQKKTEEMHQKKINTSRPVVIVVVVVVILILILVVMK